MTYRIEFRNKENGQTQMYVTDHNRTSDGRWKTTDVSAAKTWKTEKGAKRWLADRPTVESYMDGHGMHTVVVEVR